LELTTSNTTMKMVHRGSIKWNFFIFLSLIAFQSVGASDLKSETHSLLMNVNKNWADMQNEIEFTFTPSSEQELIQLHLLNVVSYLERQPVTNISKKQQENRLLNIDVLSNYCAAGSFPINNITSFRTPLFIDSHNVYCAVGYLLKEDGLGNVAQEIAEKQLLSCLEAIEHPQLVTWQKGCGLSLFELALIQPTYQRIPVCAAPSPIQWKTLKTEDSKITQLFESKNDNFIYCISELDEMGLKHGIKYYSSKTGLWTGVGSELKGQIIGLTFCGKQIYISVLLPAEDYPHQLLRLNGNEWEKIAHFNGGINSMQALQNKLYVTGGFKNVNDSIAANFVVIDGHSIERFNPVGLRNISFDHMKSSETALFLTSNGGVYKFKNDSISYLTSIKHYQYISTITLDAIADTLFLTSIQLGGYNKYFDNREQSFYFNAMMYPQDNLNRAIQFTKSKKVNGKMMIAGDFKSSTLIPRSNDERHLVTCEASLSGHWTGEGLLYQYGKRYYPILKEGIVVDFVGLNDRIYVLKKDGSVSYANLNIIEEKIVELKKRAAHKN
jgi:hypothetical protein